MTSKLRNKLFELADGTRTIDEVAELTGTSHRRVRVMLHRLRKAGHKLPMKRRKVLTAYQEEDYRFIAGRLLEGWTMYQIAKYVNRDVEHLENYWKLLTGNA